MIIVIDLIRNIFIIMFFVLMALEIIVLISLITLYDIPLKSNQGYVEASSLSNTMEVLASFNNILVRRYYNLETDLLLIAKHLYPMYLSQDSSVSAVYPKYLKSGRFYNSYKGCLQSGANFTNSFWSKNYYSPLTADSSKGYNLLNYIISRNNFFTNQTEDEVIDNLFNETSLNYITYYPEYSIQNGVDFYDNSIMETYVCYAISMFKTQLIRNLIFEKKYPIVNRFYLFLNSKFVFQYPLDYFDRQTFSKLNYYSTKMKGCNSDYGGNKCIESLQNFMNPNYYNDTQDIYIDKPLINNNQLVGRGCIKINFYGIPGAKNFACIDYNLNNILRKIEMGPNHNLVNLFLISPNINNDFSLYYSNVVDLNYLNKSIYSTNSLQNYRLTNDSDSLSLFHGIYYEIFGNPINAFSNEDITNFLNEYNSLLSDLRTNLNIIKKNSDICDSYSISYNNSVSIILSFLKSYEDINHNSTTFKISQDLFQFVLYPVKLNYTTYNNTNYIFNTECSSRILFYSLAMVRVGSETIPKDIYFVLILKCVRNWFFFVSLLLFANIIYFILVEIYVKYLVSPIKDIRSNLEKLIKERNIHENDENNDFDKHKFEQEEKDEQKEIKGAELTLYRNKETKKLEDLLNFLKKIVLMKQAHGNTDFKVQSKIYTKFLAFLDTLEQKENYRQCLLIIAYSKYKDKNFNDAYDALDILKKSTETEEAELLAKNDSLEQKIINLPSQILNNLVPYLNEFTENEISTDQDLNKLIKLRIFNQKVLYFYGLIKFLDFYKKKQELKNISKKERFDKMKDEYYLLEEAVVHLKKALTINSTMNFNQIKSIFTLILIARCSFYSEEYNEATNSLKEALLKFSDLNKYFFDKNLSEQIDPRVMFVTNGIIMEQILFYLARVSEKIGKRQLSGWLYNKLMEISYFKNNEIHRKATNKLYKFLFESENNYVEKKFLIEKMCRRMRKIPANKKLTIVVSENLLKNFNSSYELREVLLKCLENSMNQFDLISFFQFDTNIQSLITEGAKAYNLKIFNDSPTFCKYSGNLENEKPDFFKAMDNAVTLLNSDSEHYNEKEDDQHDKYIFAFIYSEDFRFTSKEENKSLTRKLIENNISLYTFCFDDSINEKKLMNMKKYLKDIVEGYLIIVKNFKIIKQAFQNISNKGIQKNLLQSNFENHKYII